MGQPTLAHLIIGGVIQKTGVGIDFDLLQSKYLQQYSTPQHSSWYKDQKITLAGKGQRSYTLKTLAITETHWYSDSLWIPLRIKYVTLNFFFRIIKHKSCAQRIT